MDVTFILTNSFSLPSLFYNTDAEERVTAVTTKLKSFVNYNPDITCSVSKYSLKSYSMKKLQGFQNFLHQNKLIF